MTKRFRFSLRTLFIVVTLIACWLGYHLDWIRKRHALLAETVQPYGTQYKKELSWRAEGKANPPGMLRFFGEQGTKSLGISVIFDGGNFTDDMEGMRTCYKTAAPDLKRAKALFSEAEVRVGSVSVHPVRQSSTQ